MICFVEFHKWKAAEEDETVCQYVKGRKDIKKANGVIRRMYCCHRSGRYKPSGRGIWRLKVQGSCKTGQICPASIHVEILLTGIWLSMFKVLSLINMITII